MLDIIGFRFNLVAALPIQPNQVLYDHTNPQPQITSRMPVLPTAAQYEICRGTDSRDYMINMAALIPRDPLAVTPLEATRPIRPEFVDSVPGQAGEELRNSLSSNIERVTHMLETQEDSITTCAELSAFLHYHGVCIRHEGMIYNLTSMEWLKNLLYVDMLGRTAKCILWKNLRCLVYGEKREIDENVYSSEDKQASMIENYSKE